MAGDPGVFFVTLTLICACTALFFSFECRLTYGRIDTMPLGFLVSLSFACVKYLIDESKTDYSCPSKVIIGAGLLFLLTLLNLLRTACSDPGIIPRATHAEAARTEADIKAHEQQTGAFNKPRIKIGSLIFNLIFKIIF